MNLTVYLIHYYDLKLSVESGCLYINYDNQIIAWSLQLQTFTSLLMPKIISVYHPTCLVELDFYPRQQRQVTSIKMSRQVKRIEMPNVLYLKSDLIYLVDH